MNQKEYDLKSNIKQYNSQLSGFYNFYDSRFVFLKLGLFTKENKQEIIRVMKDLEKYGRALATGKISRYISYRFRTYKEKGNIFFSWANFNKQSIITLNTNVKIKVISKAKVKIIIENHVELQKEIVKLYNNGMSLEAIAKKYNYFGYVHEYEKPKLHLARNLLIKILEHNKIELRINKSI